MTSGNLDGRGRRHLLTGAGSLAAVTGLAAATLSTGGTARAQPSPAPQPAGRRFAGKVVAVTGATSGIGRVTAEAFAREGARVAFCGRREELGREVEAGIKEAGGEAAYIRADVRDTAQVAAFVAQTVSRFGRLDIAFNNAGVGQAFGSMTDDRLSEYDAIFETNARGKYFAMVHEAAQMERQGGGTIINTSSVVGLRGLGGAGAYAASKWAVSGMTKSAAMELAPKGIRVNAVAPGAIIDTGFMRAVTGKDLTAEEVRSFASLAAMERVGTSAEVAKAVLWLASEDASFVTGEILQVDGYFLRG